MAKVAAIKTQIDDKKFDGMLVGQGTVAALNSSVTDVPAVKPSNGKSSGLGIYVNGVMNDVAKQQRSLQALADSSGQSMVGVHNASRGLFSDVSEAAGQKLEVAPGVAARATLGAAIAQLLVEGKPVNLVAHSQGGLVVVAAVKDVKATLEASGLPPEKVNEQLARIHVESFGAAVTHWPDGPTYVHYVNDKDPVANMLGLGAAKSSLGFLSKVSSLLGGSNAPTGHPGKGAVVVRFSDPGDPKLPGMPGHLLVTYLKHRVPFDEVRASQAK